MIKNTILLALLAGLSCNALAHRTWLLPSSTNVEGKEPWVTIDGAVSENLFDVEANALKLDGLLVSGPDGAPVAPENSYAGKMRSSVDLKLTKPGTYRVSLVTEGAMASYKLGGEVKRWRGAASALQKEVPANAEELKVSHQHGRLETFVTSGKTSAVAVKPSGVGIELEPLTHPNDMRAGEQARLRFLVDGKPAANLGFSLIPGGVRYRGVLGEQRFATDARGEASLTLPQAGMYWLNATLPATKEMAMQAERRLSYAATLEILPE